MPILSFNSTLFSAVVNSNYADRLTLTAGRIRKQEAVKEEGGNESRRFAGLHRRLRRFRRMKLYELYAQG